MMKSTPRSFICV